MTHHKNKKCRDNLEKKIKLIKDFGASGVPIFLDEKGFELYKGGIPQFIHVPKSLDQFRRWGDSELGITSTNKEAFELYFNGLTSLVTISAINDLLIILTAKVEAQKKESSQLKVDDLKSTIDALKDLTKQQNIVIAKYLIEIDGLEDDLRTSKNSMVLAKEAIFIENTELRSEMNELRLRIKRLVPKGVK
jgi:hypothetical protein